MPFWPHQFSELLSPHIEVLSPPIPCPLLGGRVEFPEIVLVDLGKIATLPKDISYATEEPKASWSRVPISVAPRHGQSTLGSIQRSSEFQHSIQVNIMPTNAEPPGAPEWLQKPIRALPQHLEHYRKNNIDRVRRDQFTTSGVAPETAAVAKALGSCVLDAPELQKKLVVSL